MGSIVVAARERGREILNAIYTQAKQDRILSLYISLLSSVNIKILDIILPYSGGCNTPVYSIFEMGNKERRQGTRELAKRRRDYCFVNGLNSRCNANFIFWMGVLLMS